MKVLLQSILQFLRRENNFLITAHIGADGDAYASILALGYMLDYLKKKYKIIIHDSSPDVKYAFLKGFENIRTFTGEEGPFSAAIALDVPSLNRIGRPANLLPARERCVKIDHHPEEDDFAAISLVSTAASSTSQLVFELFRESGMELDYDIATILLTGIMYDTGRFSFSNTSVRDFEIAAELLKYKVRPSQIANEIFFNNSYRAMKTIGYGLNSMQTYLDGRLAIILLPLEVMQDSNGSEIEELANYAVSIRGVEVGLFIREVRSGFFKISFRSRGRLNVNRIARTLGGGGHEHAAGCRFEGNYNDLLDHLIKEVSRNL